MIIRTEKAVVSYWNSTSNHNSEYPKGTTRQLYLIEILHQTTTLGLLAFFLRRLYLIEILHQTTTDFQLCDGSFRCILLKFYIKPQLQVVGLVVHLRCILLKFYIKPQPEATPASGPLRCILLKFYIKPQPPLISPLWFLVVSYWNSTSNHNRVAPCRSTSGLYLIEILHQTTTTASEARSPSPLYLIEILHQTTTRLAKRLCSSQLYLIEILHQTTTMMERVMLKMRCILLKFYIKPQHGSSSFYLWFCCILLKFYIKPQPGRARTARRAVVSYWNSTSNHNSSRWSSAGIWLYLIEILHQTTTLFLLFPILRGCILLKFYIKPQPSLLLGFEQIGCILLKFYIKPQPISSSLILRFGCILLKFYIKPQPICGPSSTRSVVSYWNSTSNHNCRHFCGSSGKLYLIEILHQTTTPTPGGLVRRCCILLKFYIKPQLSERVSSSMVSCILLKFYIKPQPIAAAAAAVASCILLKFYIKPQLRATIPAPRRVVSYWNSTSNHNSVYVIQNVLVLYLIEILHQTTTRECRAFHWGCVVSYWNSTSNHNLMGSEFSASFVVSYWNSTSNHNYDPNSMTGEKLYLIEILHQTTTENVVLFIEDALYLIEILHQTTTPAKYRRRSQWVVSYWNSTSNHNPIWRR